MSMELHWLLILSIFLVALLYASVGHGGASGYLAILSLWAMPPEPMAASALILNLLVSTMALASFAAAGYFSWRLAWPFALASIPAAWVGGWLPVTLETYHWLLSGVLLVAAWRLWMEWPGVALVGRPRWAIALPAGAGIGFLSGVVGIGGGVLLSPLLILKRWAGPKQAAAASAFFILVNSAAGLVGRSTRGAVVVEPLVGLLVVALLGGMVGSRLGALHCSGPTVRRVLALVLAVAALGAVIP